MFRTVVREDATHSHTHRSAEICIHMSLTETQNDVGNNEVIVQLFGNDVVKRHRAGDCGFLLCLTENAKSGKHVPQRVPANNKGG